MGRFPQYLFACVVLAAVANTTRAEAGMCMFVELGDGYIQVDRHGQAWTYALEASGPKWRTEPIGWHGPGWLSCENCSDGAKGAGGLYHFLARSSLDADPAFTPPTTAAARIERRRETFGYPPVPIGPRNLEPYASREGVRVGSLSGYAVLWRLPAKEFRKKTKSANPLRSGELGLLVVYLTDGCVTFHASLMNVLPDQNPLALLDSLLAEVRITKIDTAEFPEQASREKQQKPPG